MGQVDAGVHDSHERPLAGLPRETGRRNRAKLGDVGVDDALIEIRLAPLGHLHAVESRRIEHGPEKAEGAARGHPASRDRVHLDPA